MPLFRKKPVVIEAFRLGQKRDKPTPVPAWFGSPEPSPDQHSADPKRFDGLARILAVGAVMLVTASFASGAIIMMAIRWLACRGYFECR